MNKDLKSKLGLYFQNKKDEVIYEKDIQIINKFNIEGEEIHNDFGKYYLIESKYQYEFIHGNVEIKEILTENLFYLNKACKVNVSYEIKDCLFLDTETTGLSGVGVVAFLVGVGYFDQSGFVLRQYFMRDFDEEYAMLNDLNDLISKYNIIISFNGKSFDWNLILSRMSFNRIKIINCNKIHLDILYPSRLIWRDLFENCKLSSLEENLLSLIRIDDIKGELIPSEYFKFIETHDTTNIKKILTHNEKDILSMISLVVKISKLTNNPIEIASSWREILGVSRLFEKNEFYEMAIMCYLKCLESKKEFVISKACKKLAYIYKHLKDYENMMVYLEKFIINTKNTDFEVLIDIAKYYEHKEKNYEKAEKVVRESILLCSNINFYRKKYLNDLKYRLDRILRKKENKSNFNQIEF